MNGLAFEHRLTDQRPRPAGMGVCIGVTDPRARGRSPSSPNI